MLVLNNYLALLPSTVLYSLAGSPSFYPHPLRRSTGGGLAARLSIVLYSAFITPELIPTINHDQSQ